MDGGGPAEGGRGHTEEEEGHISPPSPLITRPQPISPLPLQASRSPHTAHRTPRHRTVNNPPLAPFLSRVALHNILQCLCSQELIEPKLAATSAATSYSVFPPSEAPNSPLPAADLTPKLPSAAVASISPEAAAAVPKAVAEAVAVPEPPPVIALGPDTGATVRSKAAGKTFDWYKVGDLAQDWQARAKPPRSNENAATVRFESRRSVSKHYIVSTC